MLPDIDVFHHKSASSAQVLKLKLTTRFICLNLFCWLAMLVAYQAHAVEDAANANLYAEHYVQQNQRQLQSLNSKPETQLEVRKNQEEDNLLMLENGYDLMGTSSFVTTGITDAFALQHGQAIKADKVLVYQKNVPINPKIVRLDGDKEGEKFAADVNKANERTPHTIHSASYWAKLPTPTLGVHVIKLIPAENADGSKAPEVPGLRVIAVIKASPAATSGILKGDNLLKIGEQTLEKSDDLFAAVKRYAGQTVPVEVQRGTETVKMQVALNARK